MSIQKRLVDALIAGRDAWNADIQRGKFQDLLKFEFVNVTFPPSLDLSFCSFPRPLVFNNCVFTNVNFAEIGGHFAQFTKTKFLGDLNLGGKINATFDECSFEGFVFLNESAGVLEFQGQEGTIRGLSLRNPTGSIQLLDQTILALQSSAEIDASIIFERCVIRPSLNNGFANLVLRRSAKFLNCEIQDPRIFENTQFRAETSFAGTVFTIAPSFHGAALHQSTRFDDPAGFDRQFPDVTSDGAEYCYRTLKLAMANQHAISEQLAFGRLELRARQAAEKGWSRAIYATYGLASNYGLSVGRPILCLVALTLLSPIWVWLMSEQTNSIINSDYWNLSFANSFPYLGVAKSTLSDCVANIINPRFWYAFSILSGIQSTASAALLFLTGLGIRNRLRLK